MDAHAWIHKLAQPLSTSATGPLAGVRVAIKDNIDVAGVATTCACERDVRVPDAHAFAVGALLDAGAVVAGKTNLDQFACGLNGMRSPYGEVPNAFDPAYVCGGSSSGSAYVVATGEVDVALGTDTAGSGRVPAGFNNIVGLKPSGGLVSVRGVVPASRSFDCVSVFASTVAQAIDVLAVLARHDPDDPLSRDIALDMRRMPAPFRFAVPRRVALDAPDLHDAFDGACRLLQALGGTAVPVDDDELADIADWLYDSALVAERLHAIHARFVADPDAIVEPVRSIVARGRDVDAVALLEMQWRLAQARRRHARLWDTVETFVVPTTPAHPTRAAMAADPIGANRRLGRYTNFVNPLDWAALAVPAAMRENGLPFGITFIGPSGSDWRLAELGQRFHHAAAERHGLMQGATDRPLPPARALARPAMVDTDVVRLAVVGAHLSGLPLNHELTGRGARLLATTRTAAAYRLYALPGTSPPKPGLVRVTQGGMEIEVEVWALPAARVGEFLRGIPSPLGLGTVRLADGSDVHGFVCEAFATNGALDVSTFGGWRAYRASAQVAA